MTRFVTRSSVTCKNLLVKLLELNVNFSFVGKKRHFSKLWTEGVQSRDRKSFKILTVSRTEPDFCSIGHQLEVPQIQNFLYKPEGSGGGRVRVDRSSGSMDRG